MEESVGDFEALRSAYLDAMEVCEYFAVNAL